MLSHIAKAMVPGYSRLIISECVLRSTGNDLKPVGFDSIMGYALAARERTMEEFGILVETSRMKVVGSWEAPDGGEGVVECTLT